MSCFGLLALKWMRASMRRKFGLQIRRWVGPGYDVAYLESASASAAAETAPLVFLHGLGASKDQWGAAIYALAKDHRCLFLDLPGEGESTFDENLDYAPVHQVQRIQAFLDALGLVRVVLVGASVGGCIAALFAADHPERVERLITMAPAGVAAEHMSAALRDFLDSGRHPFGYRDVQEMYCFWGLVFAKAPKVPGFIARALARKGRDRYPLINKIVHDFAAAGVYPLQARLAEVRAATLVIWGEHDRIFDVSGVAAMVQALDDVQTCVIPGVGHVPYIEGDSDTLATIRAFLAGC